MKVKWGRAHPASSKSHQLRPIFHPHIYEPSLPACCLSVCVQTHCNVYSLNIYIVHTVYLKNRHTRTRRCGTQMNTGSAMQCVQTPFLQGQLREQEAAAEMWGTWRHTRLSRQEGGLIQDIKGGVESQPSVNHTGDQERLLCISLVLNWPHPSFNHGTLQGKLVLGQMYHVTLCFLQLWSNKSAENFGCLFKTRNHLHISPVHLQWTFPHPCHSASPLSQFTGEDDFQQSIVLTSTLGKTAKQLHSRSVFSHIWLQTLICCL